MKKLLIICLCYPITSLLWAAPQVDSKMSVNDAILEVLNLSGKFQANTFTAAMISQDVAADSETVVSIVKEFSHRVEPGWKNIIFYRQVDVPGMQTGYYQDINKITDPKVKATYIKAVDENDKKRLHFIHESQLADEVELTKSCAKEFFKNAYKGHLDELNMFYDSHHLTQDKDFIDILNNVKKELQ